MQVSSECIMPLILPDIGNLCKISLFVQFLYQAQILILEIFNVCLRLKFSPSSNLNKNGPFPKVSMPLIMAKTTQDRLVVI